MSSIRRMAHALGLVALLADLPAYAQTPVSNIYAYDGVQTKKIFGSTDAWILNVAVSNSRIVWQSQGPTGAQVFLYDGAQIVQLTDDAVGGFGPRVSDSHVLWTSVISGQTQLFLYDGSQATQITASDANKTETGLDGDKALWIADGDIFTYEAGNTTQLTNATPTHLVSWPRVGGGRVTWVEQELGSHSEIYLRDGATTTQITHNNLDDVNDGFPQVSDSLLIWDRIVDPDGELLLFDGTQTLTLAESDYGSTRDLAGSRIVWSQQSDSGSSYDLSLFESGLTTTLANTTGLISNPSISNAWVAWLTRDFNDNLVNGMHAYDGVTTVDLPFNSNSNFPLASGTHVVLWESYFVPEPSSLLLLAGCLCAAAVRIR